MRLITTGDGSKTLYSDRYKQTYHSAYGAVTESRTVFLEGSRLQQQLEACRLQQEPLRVLEIGFGLGLNFLLSADQALENQTKLAYTAIENNFINTSLLADLNYRSHLKFPEIADNLLRHLRQLEYSSQSPNKASIRFEGVIPLLANGITLNIENTLETIDRWTSNSNDGQPCFDIIYLDAFSPDTNPECWSPAFIAKIYCLLKTNGTLVTYSAKGSVRRGLQAAGFYIEKLPGPPGKREFLRASMIDPANIHDHQNV